MTYHNCCASKCLGSFVHISCWVLPRRDLLFYQSYLEQALSMSQAKQSSLPPRSRAAPKGSAVSGVRVERYIVRKDDTSSSSSSSGEDAHTAAKSTRQKSSYRSVGRRRKSNVTIDPSDSVSCIGSKAGPRSQAIRQSSQNGGSVSGSAALTENNLEHLNEVTQKSKAGGGSTTKLRSDQQEIPASLTRSSRVNGDATGGGVSRSQSARQPAGAGTAYSRSRHQTESSRAQDDGEVRKYRYAPSRGLQTIGATGTCVDDAISASPLSRSRSRAQTQSQYRSRHDSKTEKDQVSRSQKGSSAVSGDALALSKSVSPSSGWERKVRVITKVYPDGREEREREITTSPVGAG